MRQFMAEVAKYRDKAREYWEASSEQTKVWLVGGITGVAVLMVGGLVLEAALTGAVVNGFFWWGMWNPATERFLQAHGRKLDVLLMLGSIGIGLVVGPTMGLSLLFISGFFSLIRRGLVPPESPVIVHEDVKVLDVQPTEVKEGTV